MSEHVEVLAVGKGAKASVPGAIEKSKAEKERITALLDKELNGQPYFVCWEDVHPRGSNISAANGGHGRSPLFKKIWLGFNEVVKFCMTNKDL